MKKKEGLLSKTNNRHNQAIAFKKYLLALQPVNFHWPPSSDHLLALHPSTPLLTPPGKTKKKSQMI